MEELDEKLIAKCQRIFNCSEGRDVLDAFCEASGVEAPQGFNSVEESNYIAGWHDAFWWIKSMIDYTGEDNNE